MYGTHTHDMPYCVGPADVGGERERRGLLMLSFLLLVHSSNQAMPEGRVKRYYIRNGRGALTK